MLDKGRLLKITDLKLSGKLDKMNPQELELYICNLDSFVEIFSELENDIKNTLASKDYNTLSGQLEMICDMLKRIHADRLAGQCQAGKDGLLSRDHEKIEAYIIRFLSSVSGLSIDIQMAQNSEDTAGYPAAAERPGGKALILAVDDATFFLNTLKAFMQGLPYKLVCMTSAEAALKFIEGNRPDLFILDIEMPGINGYELAAELRRAGQEAPIIFLTGNATKEYVVKAIKAGAADFLVKPISKEQVLGRVGKYI